MSNENHEYVCKFIFFVCLEFHVIFLLGSKYFAKLGLIEICISKWDLTKVISSGQLQSHIIELSFFLYKFW